MMIYQHIQGLIQKGIETNLIDKIDQTYVRNQVLALLNLQSFPETVDKVSDDTIPDLIDNIVDYAAANNVIENVFDDKEILSANIMNCFVARPSVVNDIFWKKYEVSPQEATNYFYHLSKNSNYIQMNRIKKNIQFKAATQYGEMDITINMSKPEKDPEQIKRERALKQNVHYPKCLLCVENEGYAGRTGHPARANHRIVQVQLANENWFLQYSPYVYYNEHSILLSEKHRDMKINKSSFENLLAFIEKFPHYFIGSNADLPIVGGSILSHDHYQAGKYDFPMTHVKNALAFTLAKFETVDAAFLKWPLTTIRLQSKDIETLTDAADFILNKWKNYSDEEAEIHAFTGDTPHNTITPIARMREDKFELDLVLRNNRTTDEHPLGIFHPHADVHHIKKENIGLIEVMGLAVLPARLQEEINEIKKDLLGQQSNIETYHQEWTEQIKCEYKTFTSKEQVDQILEKELGKKFARVLRDAGVFKDEQTCKRFIKNLNE
jgi:UDPglucose--hexose-1-phosphate uridylyltransferase